MDYSDCVGKKRGGRDTARVDKVMGRSHGGSVVAAGGDGLSKAHDLTRAKRYASGGAVEGESSAPRGDKASRTPKTSINININATPSKGEKGPEELLRALAAAAPPPNPPPAGPPPGMGGPPDMGPGPGGPMGGPPGMPPMPMMPGMKTGGRAAPKMHAGAGSGEGRLEKTADAERVKKILRS